MATEGCYVQIWEDTNYNDNSLILHGPAEYANMRNLPDAHGKDWGDQIGSLRTGPRCWIIAYADENFEDTSIIIGPDSQIPDLGDMEDEIDSIRILDHNPARVGGQVLEGNIRAVQGRFAAAPEAAITRRAQLAARSQRPIPVPADSQQGVVCFETRGTPYRVTINGRWRGGPHEPEVGLSGNPNKIVNGMPHMCLLFKYWWMTRDLEIGEHTLYAVDDIFDFCVPQEGFVQMRLTLAANDESGRFADNTGNVVFTSEPVEGCG